MKKITKYVLCLMVASSVFINVNAEETITDDEATQDQLLLPTKVEVPMDEVEKPMENVEDKADEPMGKLEQPVDKVEEPPLEGGEESLISYGSGDVPEDEGVVTHQEVNITEEKDRNDDKALHIELTNTETLSVNLSDKGITKLTESMFKDKLDNLKDLVLKNNNIEIIDKNTFSSAVPRLETMDLSGNALTTLDPETFMGVPLLTELDLSGNTNLQLPAGSMFLNINGLKKLNMTGCGLTQLPENTFDGMTSLEELDLGGNPIAEDTPITKGVFAALTNLSSLNLPAGTSPSLVVEVCRSHGLLPVVCLDTCYKQSIPCHIATEATGETQDETTVRIIEDPFWPKTNETTKAETERPTLLPGSRMVLPKNPETLPMGKVLEDFASSAPPTKSEAEAEGDSVPKSSTAPVTAGGANKVVLGLIIGGMVAVVAGVVIAKNWRKITGKGEEPVRRRTEPQDNMKGPEEVPLRNKTPPV